MTSRFAKLILIIICPITLLAQNPDSLQSDFDTLGLSEKSVSDNKDTIDWEKIEINGNVYSALIQDGDTIILADLDNISISSPRKFNSRDEYIRYYRYKRYAAVVYPYAVEAVKLFKNIEYDTQNMKKRKRKKYIKGVQKEYEVKFEEPLKRLSKTQGKILVKMIERELNTPMFTLVKSIKGNFTAFYWNQFSKLYGYRLKDGYQEGENFILDIVLQDFDINYDPASRVN